MKKFIKTVPIVLCLLLPLSIPGFTQVLENFSLTNVLNNQAVSLDTYPSCRGILLIFTSNNCPYDEYYRKRIQQLANTYQENVPVLLVNAHTEPAEAQDKMVAKGNALKLRMPYLADKNQILMSRLNIKKSPEAVLLRNNNGKFTVVYRGAIDDNAQVESDVRHHYLRDAIDIMLNNQQVQTPEVRPVGCNIKKKV